MRTGACSAGPRLVSGARAPAVYAACLSVARYYYYEQPVFVPQSRHV